MKPDPKFNGRYVQGAGGTRLFVEEIGDRARPSILWLHAYCQCRLSWDKQFESDLTQQFHLVRMDIRGHGLSDKPSDPEAFTDGKNWADDIHAVHHRIGVEEACHVRLVLWRVHDVRLYTPLRARQRWGTDLR